MPMFRKKPVTIEARRFIAVTVMEQTELADWCGGLLRGVRLAADTRVIEIPTLEGTMEAQWGDWIIKGVKGEFYPCKDTIFQLTYEAVPCAE